MIMTKQQQEIVNKYDLDTQVIACAGSGKTQTMVDRVLNMIASKINPKDIVVLTFTNEAANEISARIHKEYSIKFGSLQGLAEMYIGTFHGFAIEILMNNTSEYKNFEMIEEIQTRLFIKKHSRIISEVVKSMEVDYKKISGEVKRFSLYEFTTEDGQYNETFTTYLNLMNIIREELLVDNVSSNLRKLLIQYRGFLKQHKVWDFSEILYTLYEKIKNGFLNEYIKNNIKFIVFDEFQDINKIQYEIIKDLKVINPEITLCVVGDDDQSIYQWRGSNNQFISDFLTDYPNAIQLPLSVNFRSSEGIVDVANIVARNNHNRMEKSITSSKTVVFDNNDIQIVEFENLEQESNAIVKQIQQLVGIKTGEISISNGDIAILVRSTKKINSTYKILLEKLQKAGIAYIIEGVRNLLEAPIIHNVIKLMEDLYNNKNMPINLTYWETDLGIERAEFLEAYNKALSYKGSHSSGYLKIEFTILSMINPIVYLLFEKLDDDIVENEKVLYNIAKFTNIVNDFEKIYFDSYDNRLKEFIDFIKSDAAQVYDEGWLAPKFKAKNIIRIMTIHQSKGLQFAAVFIPFLDSKMYRNGGSGGISIWHLLGEKFDYIKERYDESIESANRLFYVAVTRAKKFLFMSCSEDMLPKNHGLKTNGYKHILQGKNSTFSVHYYVDIDNRELSDGVVFEPLRLALDFSTLKAFYECPYKFKLRHVYGIASPINVRMGYGKSLHNILEYIHKSFRNNGELKETPEELTDRFIYMPYAGRLSHLLSETKIKIIQTIEGYLKMNTEEKLRSSKLVEQKVSYMVGDFIFINGRIDLVRDEKTSETTLVDFKSDNATIDPELIEKQLYLYALGYEHLTGEKADNIEMYDLKELNPHKYKVTQDKLDLVKEELVNIHTDISSQHYCLTSIEKRCKECDFNSICKRQGILDKV